MKAIDAEIAALLAEEPTLGDVLRRRANSHGAAPFLRFDDVTLTFAAFNDRVNRAARGLTRLGVDVGEHVALMLPNCAELPVLLFALAKLGAIAIPINTAFKGELLRYVLHNSRSRLLLLDSSYIEQLPAEAEGGRVDTVILRGEGRLPWRHPAQMALAELFSEAGEEPAWRGRGGDLQAIMYTSGTTGPSKGVMVPHTLALTCARDFIRCMDFAPEDAIYCPLPLFHAAGLWDGLLSALLAGSSIAVVPRFSASRFWADVRRFEATVAMGIFSMVPILLKQPPSPEDKNHTLRAFYVGRSTQDAALYERFGVRAVENYASTEAGIPLYSRYGAGRPGSCGELNDAAFEAKVVDEWDRELPPGEAGELVLRPKRPFVMTPGYYNYPEATAKSFRNLWFHTGDRVYCDDDGYFFFVDRIKDCIRRRGENVSAFELEEVVNGHPEVLESAAFPMPAALEDDDIALAVVCRPGANVTVEQLAAYCEKQLPRFMVPRYLELLDALPKTPTEKIAKHELRKRGIANAWDREAKSQPAMQQAAAAATTQPAG